MVDHIRTLLLNPRDLPGYLRAEDGPADRALALFGLDGSDADAARVDVILPFALADDLAWFSGRFDPRRSPAGLTTVYRHAYATESGASLSLDGLRAAVLGPNGWWAIAPVFSHRDPLVTQELMALRRAAGSRDAAYALGAVLLACAYRRQLLQEGGL